MKATRPQSRHAGTTRHSVASGLNLAAKTSLASRSHRRRGLLPRCLLCAALLWTGFPFAGPAAPSPALLGQPPEIAIEPVRVLYLEGEPRFEYKFLRRAVGDDSAILMESIVHLRSDSQQSDEPLIAKDQLSQESLARRDVLILGNLGRTDFSDTQLENIADWVEAGGSLLLLGGRNALALGDWPDSPLDALLPIEPYSPSLQRRLTLPSEEKLYEPTDTTMADQQARLRKKMEEMRRLRNPPPPNLNDANRVASEIERLKREQIKLRQELEQLPGDPLERREAVVSDYIPNSVRGIHVEVEPAAVDHPALAFEEGIDAFLETLPALDAFQLVAMPRDEAVVLLRGRNDPSFTVLAYAERGAGICAVLTATNTWHWQMNAEISAADTRHERFWGRLLKWLAGGRMTHLP